MDSKDILNDLVEILAEIEIQLNSLSYGEARDTALRVHQKLDKLISAISRDGRTLMEAEQVVAEYAAINQSLDPAIDGVLCNHGTHDAMAAIQQNWTRRRWAAFHAAASAGQQSAQAALLANF